MVTKRRTKGDGSITKLPNGHYKMTITIGVGADGKQKRKSVTAKTKTELMKRVNELRVSIGKPTGEKMYFKDVVQMYLDYIEGTLRYNTIRGMPKTKRRRISQRKVDVVAIPSETQMQKILQEAKEKDLGVPEGDFKLYPFFLLAIATGARFGELLDIDREREINLETNTIDINTQVTREGSGKPLKTASSRRRIFVQPKVLRAVLEMAPRSKETTKLWLNRGRQVTYMAASMKVFNFISRSHEVPKGFTFHCFRHYHATYLLMQGVNVKEVSKRLGHSSITTTLDLYAHWVPEMDASAANTIGTKFIL